MSEYIIPIATVAVIGATIAATGGAAAPAAAPVAGGAAAGGGMSGFALPLAMGSMGLGAMATQQSAQGAMAAGESQKAAASFEARQLEQRAGQERAVAQRQSIESSRQGDLAISRASALASASGGGSYNPGIARIIGGLAEDSELRRQLILSSGEERAIGSEMDAASSRMAGTISRSSGRSRRNTAYLSGASTLAGDGFNMYSRYK